jgi:ABC-type sugar transport system substrate-binding protein
MHDRVVLIPRMSVDAQWLSLSVGAMEAAKSSGASLFRAGPSDDTDVRTQIALMNRAIDARVRGVVVYPITFFTMDHIIQEALSKRTPVVVLVAPIGITPSDHLSYVLADEDEGARLIAQRVMTSLGESPLGRADGGRHPGAAGTLHLVHAQHKNDSHYTPSNGRAAIDWH